MSAIGWAAARAFFLHAPLFLSAAASALFLKFDLLRALKFPIDGGARVRGRRLFGDNKTWRIVVAAMLGAIAGVLVERAWLADLVGRAAVLDYRRVNPIWLGVALGGGAMLGELPNSFVKRRLDVAPGAAAGGRWAALFYFWDQVDLLTGTWPLLLFWLRPDALMVAVSFALALAIHPPIALLGYLLGARRSAR